MATDVAGNAYVTGLFDQTVDFAPGPGAVQKIGSLGTDIGRAIAVDGASNVYTIGSFEGTVDFDPSSGTVEISSNGFTDIFIHKLDSDGNFQWAHSIGGVERDRGDGIALDSTNGVAIVGAFQDTVDFDIGPDTANLNATWILDDLFISRLVSSPLAPPVPAASIALGCLLGVVGFWVLRTLRA